MWWLLEGMMVDWLAVHKVVSAAARYGMVGILCAVLNVGIVYVGTELIRIGYVMSALVTCIITIPISYIMHVRFSFEGRLEFRIFELIRFLFVQFAQFFVGFGVVALQVELLGIRPWIAMLFAIGLLYVLGFFLNSVWVFNYFNIKKMRNKTGLD